MHLTLPQKMVALLGLFSLVSACGRPSQEAVNVANGMIPVNSDMAFATKCPLTGILDAPEPAILGMWDCPLNVDSVELTRPPQPLILQADCKKKTLQVMTADMRTLVAEFNILINGHFDLFIDQKDFSNANEIIFETDHSGTGGSCAAYPQLNVWGDLKCNDRDKVEMNVKARWNFAAGELPEDFSPSQRQCQIPRGCYFYSEAQLNQCSS